LTLIDPACGSGHILVDAYELFKALYLERGYRQRDVANLILEKNLFGLDIDGRAAQLTGFALMMKGRADYRRLFERGVKLNVMALADSVGFDAEGPAKGGLGDYGLEAGDLTELKRLFEHATTFSSLIQVPEGLAAKLLGFLGRPIRLVGLRRSLVRFYRGKSAGSQTRLSVCAKILFHQNWLCTRGERCGGYASGRLRFQAA